MSEPPSREAPKPGPSADIRPVVGQRQGSTSVYLFAAFALALGALLFGALDARRRAAVAPVPAAASPDLARAIQPTPQLFVPPGGDMPADGYSIERWGDPVRPIFASPLGLTRAQRDSYGPLPEAGANTVPRYPRPAVLAPPAVFMPPSGYVPPQPRTPDMSRGSSDPLLVIDGLSAPEPAVPGQAAPVASPLAAAPGSQARARAGRLRNAGTVVPQGTAIPAVLETALDSSRPGQARALVSLDVRSFDGSRVLIPRGSRLYGEYLADFQPGQKRALIQWTRLLRPDGVVIALASPGADRLGRAGVGGKVNTHFLQRFASSILQSSLDIGVAVASRSVGDGGVVLLPNGLGQSASPPPQQIPPTLKVRQGTSISVLVARDLDFAGVSAAR